VMWIIGGISAMGWVDRDARAAALANRRPPGSSHRIIMTRSATDTGVVLTTPAPRRTDRGPGESAGAGEAPTTPLRAAGPVFSFVCTAILARLRDRATSSYRPPPRRSHP
jgi:hypothetical protein